MTTITVARPDFRGQRGPASIRFNNPGAQYPGPVARALGSVGTEIIGGGHKIAVFASAIDGAAAHLTLLERSYTDMTLEKAITRWSGGNSVGTYLAVVKRHTGLERASWIPRGYFRDPATGIPFAKAMAEHEAGRGYPLTDAQWTEAHRLAFGAQQPPHASVAVPVPDHIDAKVPPVARAEVAHEVTHAPQQQCGEAPGPGWPDDCPLPAPAARDVVRTGSRKWRLLNWIKGLFGVGGAGAAADQAGVGQTLVDSVSGARSVIDPLVGFATSYGAGALIVVCLGGFVVVHVVQRLIEDDYADGRYEPSKSS